MKQKRIRNQRRAGHVETRLAMSSVSVAALALYPVFHRIRQEKRHLEPVLFSKPLLIFESWGEPWHALAVLTSLAVLIVVAVFAAALLVAGLARLLDFFQARESVSRAKLLLRRKSLWEKKQPSKTE